MSERNRSFLRRASLKLNIVHLQLNAHSNTFLRSWDDETSQQVSTTEAVKGQQRKKLNKW
jgi:hypothetical protein